MQIHDKKPNIEERFEIACHPGEFHAYRHMLSKQRKEVGMTWARRDSVSIDRSRLGPTLTSSPVRTR